MLKNQKGITLVALVITIIVLLILAGVAITLALDANGLFNHANNAVQEWNKDVDEESRVYNDLLDKANVYASQYGAH